MRRFDNGALAVTMRPMPNFYPLVKPMLMSLDAERAHGLTIGALKAGLGGFAKSAGPDGGALSVNFLGRDLPNPVGLAAGFDKNAEVPGAVLKLGFGFTEVGTITPRPQAGNPKPRLFRLAEDDGVINRMGFNNAGSEAVADRLAQIKPGLGGMVGVNIGANKDSEDFVADYVTGLQRFDGLADYFVINISSPNTPGLRDLQGQAALAALLDQLMQTRAGLAQSSRTPLLVKIAPDLSPSDHEAICAEALTHNIDGLIVSNTTLGRPDTLKGASKGEAGGLSGRPLMALSTEMLARTCALTGGAIPLVGVGGIMSGRDAYAKICAGASVVQLYSGLVYEGPALVGRIKKDLVACLAEDGFSTIAEAVGSGAN
jgi:dihydroorotate dehydrogenase